MRNKLRRWLLWSTDCGRLGSKLMCIYFLLIVLPLGIFSFYAYVRVKNMVQEQTFSAAQNALTTPVCLWNVFSAGWTELSTSFPQTPWFI